MLHANCGDDYHMKAEKKPYPVVLAEEIKRRHPDRDYEEILYRVALLYDEIRGAR